MAASTEQQQWLDKGKEVLATIEELIDEINAREEGRRISDKYRRLKEHVRAEAKRCDKQDRDTLETDERMYGEMITKVAAYMTAPVNCNPFDGKLRDCLAYVRVDVSYFVSSREAE